MQPGDAEMPAPARRVAATATPLFWATGAVLAGQLAALVFAGPVPGAAALLLACLRGLARLYARRRAPAWPIGLAAICAAIAYAQLDATLRPDLDARHVQRWAGARIAIDARVVAPPVHQGGRTRLLLEVDAGRGG